MRGILLVFVTTVLALVAGCGGSGDSPRPSPDASGKKAASKPVRTGCIALPSACGYPDATNTGVPAGTALVDPTGMDCSKGCGAQGTGWHWEDGYLRVDTKGAVVSNVDVTGTVYVIQAAGAVIKNSRITCADSRCLAVQVRGDAPPSNDVTISDTTITDTVGGPSAGIYNTGGARMAVVRVNIGGFGGGIQSATYGWSLKDSYIHDVSVARGAHGNGVQSSCRGGAKIVHNTITNPNSGTDAVMLTNDFGCPQKDDTVTDNLLGGGGFTIYAGDTGSAGGCAKGCSNIVVQNNRISSVFFPKGGSYDWITAVPKSGATVSGNFADKTGAPLSP